jgi:transcriptional regulator with XRE-family HTH domain
MANSTGEPDDIDIEVGRRLRSLRLSKGVSQSELALAGGIRFQQVQKYERGQNRISASMLCHLAARLEVSPLALLPVVERAVENEIVLRSREVAEAVVLLDAMSPSEQRRAVKILRLLASEDG